MICPQTVGANIEGTFSVAENTHLEGNGVAPARDQTIDDAAAYPASN